MPLVVPRLFVHTPALPKRRGMLSAALAVAILACGAAHAAEEGPLAPLDLSSPRATLQGFCTMVDRVAANFDRINRERAVREENTRLIRRGLSCLDLSAVPPALLDSKGRESAVLLKEVLDRIAFPAPDTIPDAARVKADGIDRWRLPGTEIVLVKLASGPRAGDFVFSTETVARAEEFYKAARHLPYRPDAGSPGLLDAYIQSGSSARCLPGRTRSWEGRRSGSGWRRSSWRRPRPGSWPAPGACAAPRAMPRRRGRWSGSSSRRRSSRPARPSTTCAACRFGSPATRSSPPRWPPT
jgi:MscS family membrane protein